MAIAKIRGVGALTNVALNFILIPVLGIHGAAIATFISFALISGLLFTYNKKVYSIQYNMYSVGCLIGTLIALIGIIGYNPDFIMRLVIFVSLILLLFILRVIKKDNFILMRSFIKRKR